MGGTDMYHHGNPVAMYHHGNPQALLYLAHHLAPAQAAAAAAVAAVLTVAGLLAQRLRARRDT